MQGCMCTQKCFVKHRCNLCVSFTSGLYGEYTHVRERDIE